MAKSKYIELAFADGPNYPKHSVAGYLIVSDLAGGGNRNLVLKNMNGATARKPRAAKKAAKAAKAAAGATGEATALFPSGVTNGA